MKNKYFMIGLIALIIISLLIVIENYRYLSLNKKNYIYYETSCKNNNQESCSYINSFPYYEMDANSFFISCMNNGQLRQAGGCACRPRAPSVSCICS